MRIGKLRGNTSPTRCRSARSARTPSRSTSATSTASRPATRSRPRRSSRRALIKNTKTDVKLLGVGELTKKLTVRVHAISAHRAREGRGRRRHRRASPRAEGQEGAHHKAKPAAVDAPEAADEAAAPTRRPPPTRRSRAGGGARSAVAGSPTPGASPSCGGASSSPRPSSPSTGSARGSRRRASTRRRSSSFFSGAGGSVLSAAQPLLGLGAARASRCSRSGSCRTSRPRSSSSC